MKKDRGNLAFEVLILFLVLFFIVASFGDDPRVRLMPLLVGSSTLLLVLALLVNSIHPVSIFAKIDVDWTKDLRLPKFSEKEAQEFSVRQFMIIVCWIFGFFLSIILFGFHLSIPLYTFAFLKIQGRINLFKAMLAAGLTWAAVFAIFEAAMDFGLFGGVLFGEILPPL